VTMNFCLVSGGLTGQIMQMGETHGRVSLWSRKSVMTGLLLFLTLLAYVPAMQGGFIWDDDSYVTENQTLRSLEGLEKIWVQPNSTPQYYPLVFSSFWLEYKLWGLNPTGYHLVNILLHALSALHHSRVLVYLKVPGACLAAVDLALHPVHVESVAWVAERKNVLSGFFYFSSAFCLFRFFGLAGESWRHWRRFSPWGWRWDWPRPGWRSTTLGQWARSGICPWWRVFWLPGTPSGFTWASWSGHGS
ncbi:MAG: hypothetical protein P8017_09605, partial [Deltaproteobacteria bacterium]